MIEMMGDIDGRQIHYRFPYYRQAINIIWSQSEPMVKFFRRIGKHNEPIEYIVDVGACIGTTALTYAMAFPKAKILAIEPSRENFSYLEYNTQKYPQIKPVKMAAWKKKGKIRISMPNVIQRPGRDDLIENTGMISILGKSDIFAEAVPCDTLDNLATRKVDYLKLDVEGAEVSVLRGAKRILREDRPIIQVEFRPVNQAYGQGFTFDIAQLLAELKYLAVGTITADWIYVPREKLRSLKGALDLASL